MSVSSFKCKVVSEEHILFSGDAHFVVVPGITGEMGFYEKHDPIAISLGDGIVRVVEADGEQVTLVVLSGGYAESDGYNMTVLAYNAEGMDRVNREALTKRADELQALYNSLDEDEQFEQKRLAKRDLDWANSLLQLLDTGKIKEVKRKK